MEIHYPFVKNYNLKEKIIFLLNLLKEKLTIKYIKNTFSEKDYPRGTNYLIRFKMLKEAVHDINEKFSSEFSRVRDELKHFHEIKYNQFHSTLQFYSKEFEQIKVNQEDFTNKIDEFKNTIDESAKSYETFVKNINEQVDKIGKDIREKITTEIPDLVKGEMSTISQRQNELEKVVTDLGTTMSDNIDDYRNTAQNAALKFKDEMQTDFSCFKTDISNSVTLLESDIDTVKNELNVSKTVQSDPHEIKNIQTQITELEQDFSAKINDEIMNLKTELGEMYREEIQKFLAELAQKKLGSNESTKLDIPIEEIYARISSLERENELNKEHFSNVEQQFQKTETQINDLKLAFDEFKADVNKKLDETASLNTQLRSVINQLNRLSARK